MKQVVKGLVAASVLLFVGQAADVAQQVQRARRLGQAYYEEGNYPAATDQFRSVTARPAGGPVRLQITSTWGWR